MRLIIFHNYRPFLTHSWFCCSWITKDLTCSTYDSQIVTRPAQKVSFQRSLFAVWNGQSSPPSAPKSQLDESYPWFCHFSHMDWFLHVLAFIWIFMVGWVKCTLLSLQFRVKFDPPCTGRSMDLKKLLCTSDSTIGVADMHMQICLHPLITCSLSIAS